MKTKEVADICGVSIPTITENAKKVGIVLENGKAHEYTEDELKKIQAQLLKNSFNRGSASTKEGVVEGQALNAFKGGLSLQVIMQSGNVEACKELCQMITEGTQAQHDLLLEQQKTKQLQLELDRYVNWKSASEIKSEFKLPHRPGIEKVALLLKLRENEDWIARFYDDTHMYKKILYSPEAVDRIVEYFAGE